MARLAVSFARDAVDTSPVEVGKKKFAVVQASYQEADRALARAVYRDENMEDYSCKDPVIFIWEGLKEALETLHGGAGDDWLKREYGAGISAVNRRLECRESDQDAFDALRAVYWKVSAAKEDPQKLNHLRQRLEILSRVAPGLDSAKDSSGWKDFDTFEDSHLAYRTLVDIKEKVKLLGRLARLEPLEEKAGYEGKPKAARGKQFKVLGAINEAAASLMYPRGGETGQRLGASVEVISKAVVDLSETTRRAEEALASCDSEKARETLGELEGCLSQLSFAYGNMLCELGHIKSLAQPAFFTTLQAKLEEFGFLAAEVVSAFSKLRLSETGPGKQLRSVWIRMRDDAGRHLKQAFERWQEHQVCPQTLCYETATLALRKAIEEGVADSERLASHACSEEVLCQHRRFVDKATDEVQKLYCKTKHLEKFDTCVLTRLGAYTMRLQSVLGRSTTNVADAVRTTIASWEETRKWFKKIGTEEAEEPSPRVARQLRTILGIYRWLENKAQGLTGSSTCIEPSSSVLYSAGPELGARRPIASGYPVDAARVRAGWIDAQRVLDQVKAQNLLPQHQVATLSDLVQKETASVGPPAALLAAGERLKLARFRGLLSVYLAKAADAAAQRVVCLPSVEQAKLAALQRELGQVMQAVGGTAV